MKLIKKLSTLVVLSSVSGLGLATPTDISLTSANLTDVNVNITGNVIASACKIETDNSIKLDTVLKANIADANNAVNKKQFVITLSNCPTDETLINLKSFRATVADQVDAQGNLKNTAQNGASGVSLKVSVATREKNIATAPTTYTDIVFVENDVSTNTSTSYIAKDVGTGPGQNGNTAEKLYFQAGYVRTVGGSEPGTGAVTAGFIFNVDYN